MVITKGVQPELTNVLTEGHQLVRWPRTGFQVQERTEDDDAQLSPQFYEQAELVQFAVKVARWCVDIPELKEALQSIVPDSLTHPVSWCPDWGASPTDEVSQLRQKLIDSELGTEWIIPQPEAGNHSELNLTNALFKTVGEHYEIQSNVEDSDINPLLSAQQVIIFMMHVLSDPQTLLIENGQHYAPFLKPHLNSFDINTIDVVRVDHEPFKKRLDSDKDFSDSYMRMGLTPRDGWMQSTEDRIDELVGELYQISLDSSREEEI